LISIRQNLYLSLRAGHAANSPPRRCLSTRICDDLMATAKLQSADHRGFRAVAPERELLNRWNLTAAS
jgi:hypothetical protein